MLLFQLKSGDFEAVMVSMYYQGFDYREITFVGKVNSNPEAEWKDFQPLAESPKTGSNLETLNAISKETNQIWGVAQIL